MAYPGENRPKEIDDLLRSEARHQYGVFLLRQGIWIIYDKDKGVGAEWGVESHLYNYAADAWSWKLHVVGMRPVVYNTLTGALTAAKFLTP